MAKINRFNGDLKAFGSQATGLNRTVFESTSQSDLLDDNINSAYLIGWENTTTNEAPAKQDFNALGFTHGQLLAYLHQAGIAEWNGLQEYQVNSYTNRGGNLYKCLTVDHIGASPPESDLVNWEVVFAGSPTTQIFTSSGTWTKPAGCKRVEVTAVGGGGAGGGAQATASTQASCGGGGGGGGAFKSSIDVSAISSVVVTVGAGGLGSNGLAGADGEGTIFGSHGTAGGGIGGGSSSVATSYSGTVGGAGGVATSGDINLKGNGGSQGVRMGNATPALSMAYGGAGGGSALFGGGAEHEAFIGGSSASGAGANGGDYGGAGSGAASLNGGPAVPGGNGGNGVLIIVEYYS